MPDINLLPTHYSRLELGPNKQQKHVVTSFLFHLQGNCTSKKLNVGKLQIKRQPKNSSSRFTIVPHLLHFSFSYFHTMLTENHSCVMEILYHYSKKVSLVEKKKILLSRPLHSLNNSDLNSYKTLIRQLWETWAKYTWETSVKQNPWLNTHLLSVNNSTYNFNNTWK